MTHTMEQMTLPGLEETAPFDAAQGATVAGKSRWPMVKLGDVCTIARGGSPRPIDKFITDSPDGVNWIKIGDSSNDSIYITKTAEKIKPEGIAKSRQVFEGDLILSNSMSFGRPYIMKTNGCIHDGWLLIRDDKNIYNKVFLCYILGAPSSYSQMKKMAVGGVVNNLNSTVIKSLEIPLPPLHEQQRIVARLDQAQRLIDQRKEQLALMDALVQALFYEMFGDPVKNEKGWEVKALGEISIVGTGSTPSREQFVRFYEGGSYPWVKTTEVNGNDIYDTEEKITQLAIDETNCKLFPPHTILLAMYGQGKTRGQVGLLKIHAATNQACAAIKCDESVDYRFAYKTLSILYSFIRSLARGGNQENLNLSIVKDIPLILPPLPLQQAFADRVQQIEALKQQMMASLAELEQNFQALMQEAFG